MWLCKIILFFNVVDFVNNLTATLLTNQNWRLFSANSVSLGWDHSSARPIESKKHIGNSVRNNGCMRKTEKMQPSEDTFQGRKASMQVRIQI